MSESSEPKFRRRKELREAEIVMAAYSIFAEKGFAAARLDDIAAAAGVSKGALYLYFETKQDIFEAVVRDAISPNIDMVGALARQHIGPVAPLLRMMLPRAAGFIAASQAGKVLKLVIGESGNFPEIARIWHDNLVSPGLGNLSHLIARGQESGEFRAGDPRSYAVSLVAPLLVGVIFRDTFAPIGAKAFDIPALMTQHVDAVLRGLLCESATP